MKPDDIDKLLMLAGAGGDAAKSALATSLELARAEMAIARTRQNQPTALVEETQTRLKQAIRQLEQLEKHPYWNDVCFETYVAGAGIAEVRTSEELFENGIKLARHPKSQKYGRGELPADGKLIAVNVKEVLRSMSDKIMRQQRKPKRGGQKK